MVSLVGTIVVCWLLADFLTGVGHWLEDQYCRPHWPILGKFVCVPNDRHHEYPLEFLGVGYLERNWTTFIFGITAMLAFWDSSLAWTGVFLSQANEIHAWGHQRCYGLIRLAQESGILQHPVNHARHHKHPFATHYCVMSDLLNPFLDYACFWSVLESIICLTTGVRSKRINQELEQWL